MGAWLFEGHEWGLGGFGNFLPMGYLEETFFLKGDLVFGG
jgi:hypothetical protein